MKVIAKLILIVTAGSVVLVAAFLLLDFVRSGDATDAVRRASELAGSVVGEPPVISRQDRERHDDTHDVGHDQTRGLDSARDPDLEEVLRTGEGEAPAESDSTRQLRAAEPHRARSQATIADSLQFERSNVSGEALGAVVRTLLKVQQSLEDGE